MPKTKNPLGLEGIAFVEFSSGDPAALHRLFTDLGFTRVARHRTKQIDVYRQGDIVFHLNAEPLSFGETFQQIHGPSISAMGWRFADAPWAFTHARERGGRPCATGDYRLPNGNPVPALYGIGESLIYFVERDSDLGFVPISTPEPFAPKGFRLIDHLTNNVHKGTMEQWASFYKNIFGFTEIRYFDIKGKKTGLTSYALKSPCGTFSIPINEADEAKSQINEYLDEYHGPGVQHLAFLTEDLLGSLRKLKGSRIEMLDIAPGYYEKAFARVPNVREDKQAIRELNVLIDGDAEGYLLQIFTKNLVGPIFIEFIQRENHLSFGEGNFQALFDSIERDQMKRGVL